MRPAKDTRAGSYQRKLQTKAGEVELTVPRLRKLPLETAIIERYAPIAHRDDALAIREEVLHVGSQLHRFRTH